MKKNNDKYWRIGIFAFVFVFGLFASVKTGNGWIALITCVVVPLLYIPYGISDWRREKPSEPPEKHNKPAKTAAAEAQVKKENTSEPPQDDVMSRIEKKKDLRNTAQSEKDDGNILKSVRKIDQLEYPFRKVEYRRNISFKDIGKEYFYRDYYIKDIVTAEDGNDYVREIRASCYDGANGRPVPSCSERYTGGGIEKCYHWLFDTYYPLPDEIDDAYDERFSLFPEKKDAPVKEKPFSPPGKLTSGKDDTEIRQNNKCAQTIVGDKPVPACSTEIWLMRGYTLEKYYLNGECSEVEIHFLEECVDFNPGGEGVDKLFRFDKTAGMFYSVYYHWDAGNFLNEHYYSMEYLSPEDFMTILREFRDNKLNADFGGEEAPNDVYDTFDRIVDMLMSWLSPAEPYRMFFEKRSDDTFSVTDTDALPKYE